MEKGASTQERENKKRRLAFSYGIENLRDLSDIISEGEDESHEKGPKPLEKAMHYPRTEALRGMSLKGYPNCSDMGHVGGVRV